MIDRINQRLLAWADWVALGRRITGLGYPSRSAFYSTPSGGGLMSPVMAEDCMLTERAVSALDPILRAAVMQFYLRAGTAETHAKALRVCVKTLYNRLHRAHERVESFLIEVS